MNNSYISFLPMSDHYFLNDFLKYMNVGLPFLFIK